MSFKDLKGQDKAISLLKFMLRSKRLPPALLFWGEEGVGKRQAALTFAKAVNCLKELEDACDECPACLKINRHNHPDVYMLPKDYMPQSTVITIEEIRNLQNYANLKIFEGKKKVFIIDEAHNLTAEASNAFLKILEEPPPDTLFILISSKPQLLFSTITSRCQKVRFSAMDKNELKVLLEKEYRLEPRLSHYLAFFYQGRLGASLRMKDKAVLREKNQIIDWFINGRGYLSDDYLSEDKEKLKYFLEVMLAWLRDIYLIKTGLPHSELINIDRLEHLLRIMPHLSFYDLDTAINFLSEASVYLEQNINPKLILANVKVKLWTRLYR
ncbi:MAG: DNA polymerase III subunit delta' [Candidatus Omnitrophica bacterium]|nr:DNA polymerase III subunit delta' [Candidatus Omnitrophota bacterium]